MNGTRVHCWAPEHRRHQAMEEALSMVPDVSDAPDVSVIIPAYNAVNYAPQAVQSVQEQTLQASAVEIITVDDGSTDGTGDVLRRLADADPRISVISQANSGTPGGARNPAIGRARGRFIFFLDSDDRLTKEALAKMLAVADSEESDVVLGKFGSDDGRRAPTSMFKKTVLDANLIEDNIFNTLNPMKLIRRELIERLQLRFPEDQRVGEDQPFMASVYLNARKISVLADMDYCVIRYRDDGANVTLTHQLAPADHVKTCVRLANVIERYTDPGALRDGLMKRPLSYSMTRALDARWLKLDRGEQQRLAEIFRLHIARLYTDGVRINLNIDTRVKLNLLLSGDLNGLSAYITHVSADTERMVSWKDGAFRMVMPGELAKLVPEEELVVPAPKMTCRLEDLFVEGASVKVTASVSIPTFQGAPGAIGLRAHKRKGAEIVEFDTLNTRLSEGSGIFRVTAQVSDMTPGVWDVFFLVRFGDTVRELRLGANRLGTIEPEGRSNAAESTNPADMLLAYFTVKGGNLSIDRGATLHKNVARAHMIGLTLDQDGRALALVETTRKPRAEDEYFASIEGVRQHGGRHLLPTIQLGDRLVGARLPTQGSMAGARLTVHAVLGGMPTPILAANTDYWPSRAAGYELSNDEHGALIVGASPRGATASHLYPRRIRTGRSGSTCERIPRRIRSRVKQAPIIGRALTRVVRALRRSHS